jgi:fatty-acyl-CoA synthase
MAALVVEDDFDLEGFYRHVERQLPAYARPAFLRIKREMETTSTFKQRKLDLVKEGFDPHATPDPLYYLNPELQAYVPLDAQGHAEVMNGSARL